MCPHPRAAMRHHDDCVIGKISDRSVTRKYLILPPVSVIVHDPPPSQLLPTLILRKLTTLQLVEDIAIMVTHSEIDVFLRVSRLN